MRKLPPGHQGVTIHGNSLQKHAQRVEKPSRYPGDLIKLMLKCMEIPEKGLIN